MRHPFLRLIYSWLLLALGVLVSAHIVPGITYENIPTLIVVAVLLSFLNAILKPILLLFALPFIVLTMGIGILFINAFLFYLVGHLVNGFNVAGFGAAFLGGLIVSIVSFLINSIFGQPRPRQRRSRTHRSKRVPPKDDDVIDI